VNTDDGYTYVTQALLQVVPDADLASLSRTESLRDALELDSLDFLSFVEQLSALTGLRLDESDYASLTTLDACVDLLSRRSVPAG
jgi:acyl carrier protein